jgi:hypothetical protein
LRAENSASDSEAATARVIATAQGAEKRSSSSAARRVNRSFEARNATRIAASSSASS